MTDNLTHAARVASLAALAAERNQAHLGGTVLRGVGAWLHHYADGKCAMCGRETRLDALATDSDRAEISHVTSVMDSKRAITPGNVFSGCRGCNLATGKRDLRHSLHLFADVFAIPTEWPTRSEMSKFIPETVVVADTSRDRRRALGFDF